MTDGEHVNDFGRRLKKRRTDLELTLKQLAAGTGLTASFISKIERGEANPSLNTLQKLSGALNVPSMYFISDELAKIRLQRAGQRRRILLQEIDVSYELLTPDLTGAFETLLIRLKPGSPNVVRNLGVNTEEMFYVLQGRLLVEIDDEQILLEKGDSLYVFNNNTLKSIICDGDEEVIYMAVISPPVL